MKIPTTNKLNCINNVRSNRGNCSTTFSAMMVSLSKMLAEAKSSAQTYPPSPSFEYSVPVYSGLVDSLTAEEKEQLKEVGIEFHKMVGTSTRVTMKFITS